MNVRTLLSVALATAYSLFSTALFADVTYYVALGGDGSDPTSGDLTKAYAHPQTAVDAADGTTPTTIKIATGTYGLQSPSDANTQVLNVNKSNLTIEAKDGYGTVTLAGSTSTPASNTHTRRVLTVASGLTDVTLRNLIFKGGDGYRNGGNSTCASVSSGTFENCDLIGYCIARCGMMSLGGTAHFTNCTIKTTSSIAVDANGTFTAISLGGSAVFEDCMFGPMKWYADGGGNVRSLSMGGSATLRRCTVQGIMSGRPNGTSGQGYGTWSGGGLIATGGTITDCVFTNNLVYGMGGGLCVDGKDVTVSGCRFRDNIATGRYNDIYVASGTVSDSAAVDLDGTNGNLGAYPDKEQDGAWYAIVVSNAVKAVRAGIKVPVRLDVTSGVTPTGYDWTFEDATVASGRSVTHTFAAAGTHTVTCVVTLSDSSTVTVTKKVLVVGPVCYVSKNGSNEAPYDTSAKAARHPQDALDLHPAKVEIDTGTYAPRNGARDSSILSFPYGYGDVEITAKNGRGTVWLDAGKVNPGNGALSRVVTVGDGLSNVTISDLCITNGWSCYAADNSRGTIYAYGGTFKNCSINLSGFSRNGGGLITKSAVLTNCLVTAISPYSYTGSATDIGLTVSGGAKMLDCEICDYKWCTGWTFNIPCVSLSGATSLIRGCLFHDIVIGKSGSALTGAAIYATGGTIESCTITDCKSWNKGGGLYINGADVVCRNNIIINNTAVNGGNDIGTATDYSMVNHTLASELTTGENGNLKAASVLFKTGTYELDKDSQCVNAGENQDWMDGAKDRAGNPRIYDTTVDMGAYECQEKSASLVADFSVTSASSFGPPPLDVQVTANVSGGGDGATYAWNWGDGTFLEMNATNGVVTHTYTNVGAYTIWMTVAKSGLTTRYALTNVVAAVGETCYVSTNGAAIPPYDTWAKATSNIQDAVAYKPQTVLVSNGIYRVSYDGDDYGIKLYDPIRLVSVNGASDTVIRSNYANPTAIGESTRMRNLVRMTHAGASVEGFTLRQTCPPMVYATAGRFENNLVTGAYKTSDSCNITTFAGPVGITNCVFDGTSMTIGWVNYSGALVGLSGGATMDRSIVSNATFNIGSANSPGRAAVSLSGSGTAMRNSLVTGMRGSLSAAAKDVYAVQANEGATVENCTIVGTRITLGSGAGLTADSTAKIRNVISYDNHMTTNKVEYAIDFAGSPNVFENNLIGAGELPVSAVDCLPVGTDPQFVADGAGYRIRKDSPCYNAGKNLGWCRRKGMAKDLDEQERHCNRPDIGCFEVQRELGLLLLMK